jgi:hypothetical protein
MAVAKLGAIITGLAGSVGGTTFRRSGNGLVVYNKPRNVSLSQVQANVNLVNLAGLSREYTTIPEAQKNAWRSFASQFTFPNRFGDERQISGKAMWMKCNGSLLHFEEFIEIPDGLSIEVPQIDIVDLFSIFATEKITIRLNSQIADARYFIRIEKTTYPGQNVVFNRQKVLAYGFLIGQTDIGLWNEIQNQFGRISVGDTYAFAVYGVAQVGFPLLQRVQYLTIT